MIDGEPWFIADSVCKALDIVNVGDAISRLDEDEKDSIGLTDVMGRAHKKVIINEPGLYGLVLSSRKPEAKQFKRWVKHDVLPSIRETGMYATNKKNGEPKPP